MTKPRKPRSRLSTALNHRLKLYRKEIITRQEYVNQLAELVCLFSRDQVQANVDVLVRLPQEFIDELGENFGATPTEEEDWAAFRVGPGMDYYRPMSSVEWEKMWSESQADYYVGTQLFRAAFPDRVYKYHKDDTNIHPLCAIGPDWQMALVRNDGTKRDRHDVRILGDEMRREIKGIIKAYSAGSFTKTKFIDAVTEWLRFDLEHAEAILQELPEDVIEILKPSVDALPSTTEA